LLVATRQGKFEAPVVLCTHIHHLELPENFDDVSSTEVRRRIAEGEPWRHLVPGPIADLVGEIYSR
jgi:nicotinic acid mononucleotide adenylyltransferase